MQPHAHAPRCYVARYALPCSLMPCNPVLCNPLPYIPWPCTLLPCTALTCRLQPAARFHASCCHTTRCNAGRCSLVCNPLLCSRLTFSLLSFNMLRRTPLPIASQAVAMHPAARCPGGPTHYPAPCCRTARFTLMFSSIPVACSPQPVALHLVALQPTVPCIATLRNEFRCPTARIPQP